MTKDCKYILQFIRFLVYDNANNHYFNFIIMVSNFNQKIDLYLLYVLNL